MAAVGKWASVSAARCSSYIDFGCMTGLAKHPVPRRSQWQIQRSELLCSQLGAHRTCVVSLAKHYYGQALSTAAISKQPSVFATGCSSEMDVSCMTDVPKRCCIDVYIYAWTTGRSSIVIYLRMRPGRIGQRHTIQRHGASLPDPLGLDAQKHPHPPPQDLEHFN